MSGVVYFKFRSQLSKDSVMFDGHFVSVGELKRLIAAKKNMGADAVAELVLSDPATQAEYTDDAAQIPKGSSVIIRRAPQVKHRALVGSTLPQLPPPVAPALPAPVVSAPAEATAKAAEYSGSKEPEAVVDEFGVDPYAQQAAAFQQEEQLMRSAQAAAETQYRQEMERGPAGRGRGRGRGGRGRPDPSYICHRCGLTGHWISDCPTNSDPAYDVKRVRLPAGIPVTKLQRNADGSLVLPTGEYGELMPNQKAFAEQIALMTGAAPAGAKQEPPAAATLELPAPTKPEQPTPPQPSPAAEAAPEPATTPTPAAELEQLAPATSTAEAAEASTAPGPDAVAASTADGEPVAAAEPAAAPAATDLFDDNELSVPLEPIKLTLASEAADKSKAPSPSAAASGGGISRRQDGIPEDLRGKGATPREFMEYLPLLVDLGLLPRADVKILLRAFGSGTPLARDEFEEMCASSKYSKLQTMGQSRHTRAERSRSRSKDRSRRSRRGESPPMYRDDRRRPRARSRSKSPLPEFRHAYPRSSPPQHSSDYRRRQHHHLHHHSQHHHQRQEASEPSTRHKDPFDLRDVLKAHKKVTSGQDGAAEASFDGRSRPERQQSKVLQADSRVVDRQEEIAETAGGSRKKARAGSAEASTDRADDRSYQRNDDMADPERITKFVNVDQPSPESASPAGAASEIDERSTMDRGAVGEEVSDQKDDEHGKRHKKKHRKHKKHGKEHKEGKEKHHKKDKKRRRSEKSDDELGADHDNQEPASDGHAAAAREAAAPQEAYLHPKLHDREAGPKEAAWATARSHSQQPDARNRSRSRDDGVWDDNNAGDRHDRTATASAQQAAGSRIERRTSGNPIEAAIAGANRAFHRAIVEARGDDGAAKRHHSSSDLRHGASSSAAVGSGFGRSGSGAADNAGRWGHDMFFEMEQPVSVKVGGGSSVDHKPLKRRYS